MLTAAQRADFEERGFVRIPSAFSRGEASAMEARVWAWLERRYGLCRGDPTTWTVSLPTGLQGLKRQPVFDAIGGVITSAALDGLLGAGRWQRPRDWGQFLVSFPSPGSWTVPTAVWHTDFGFLGPCDRPFGALVFSFLSDVPAGAGGTTVVAGSHRLLRSFIEGRPRAAVDKLRVTRKAFLRSDAWLKALSSGVEDPDRVDKLMRGAVVAGVPVQVAELCGEAGDVVIGHNWLLHAGAPNRGAQPRLMRVQRVHLAVGREPA